MQMWPNYALEKGFQKSRLVTMQDAPRVFFCATPVQAQSRNEIEALRKIGDANEDGGQEDAADKAPPHADAAKEETWINQDQESVGYEEVRLIDEAEHEGRVGKNDETEFSGSTSGQHEDPRDGDRRDAV